MKDLHEIASRSRNAFFSISVSSAEKRNDALSALARLLEDNCEEIFAANQHDLNSADREDPRAYGIGGNWFGDSQIIHCVSPCNGAYYTISPPSLTGGKHSRRNFKHFQFSPSGFAPEGHFFVASIFLLRAVRYGGHALRGGCRAGFRKITQGEIQ